MLIILFFWQTSIDKKLIRFDKKHVNQQFFNIYFKLDYISDRLAS